MATSRQSANDGRDDPDPFDRATAAGEMSASERSALIRPPALATADLADAGAALAAASVPDALTDPVPDLEMPLVDGPVADPADPGADAALDLDDLAFGRGVAELSDLAALQVAVTDADDPAQSAAADAAEELAGSFADAIEDRFTPKFGESDDLENQIVVFDPSTSGIDDDEVFALDTPDPDRSDDLDDREDLDGLEGLEGPDDPDLLDGPL